MSYTEYLGFINNFDQGSKTQRSNTSKVTRKKVKSIRERERESLQMKSSNKDL